MAIGTWEFTVCRDRQAYDTVKISNFNHMKNTIFPFFRNIRNINLLSPLYKLAGATLFLLILFSCNRKPVTITSGPLVMEFNDRMEVRVSNNLPGADAIMDGFSASEYISGNRFSVRQYSLDSYSEKEENGIKSHVIRGTAKDGGTTVEKTIEIIVNPAFPGLVITNVSYINQGEKSVKINRWVSNRYEIASTGNDPDFWSFQASSSNRRLDWITPVSPGFYRENYMGMNSSDYGGGIPVVDLWRKDAGIMVGHVELLPRLVSLPVEMDRYENKATLGVEFKYSNPVEFMPGDTLKTYSTFVSVHQGDYYTALQQYSELMQYRGIPLAPSIQEAFEAVWCAWGYGREFTMQDIYGALPKVKEMGIQWVDIDDGYQITEGDWEVDKNRFSGGNPEMKRLVDNIHSYGMKAKLWWAPLAIDMNSELLRKDPNLLLMRKDGSPQYITWWNAFSMSPTYEGTRSHTREVLNMFINEWGFDGLKMDGQHLNSVAPNYNRSHGLERPEEDNERLPEFFKMIYDETTAMKPGAVIQNCPCGCAVSFYNIPWMNQAVSSDPTSSFQIRHKGKTYKAINPGLAYYGDHVELSDNKDDFGTQLGIGSVLGTKFTWPENPDKPNENLLTPEKEKLWKKWFSLYNSKMLSSEPYLGELYDIGYDKPETHVIQKGDTLFYAFYADEWNGEIEFRGLKEGSYKVRDYVNNVDIGTVTADNPKIELTFSRNLLLEAWPVKQ